MTPVRAAVLTEVGRPLSVDSDLELLPPGDGEVRVRIMASGICHTDLALCDGTMPLARVPCVPGHEGAGVVSGVGGSVTGLEPGDHVVLTARPACGTCRWCLRGEAHLCASADLARLRVPRYRRAGDEVVHAGLGLATFAEEVVVPARAAIPIAADVPFAVAALLGCGVTTGVGAVLNTARVEPGSSVIVFGCGGVGLSVVQGARLAGAAEIVAVDRVPTRRDAATRFGASHACAPEEVDQAVKELTDGDGFDYAFDVVGHPDVLQAAWAATRRGGTAVVVGAAPAGAQVTFDAYDLLWSAKRLVGTLWGSADGRVEFGRLVGLWRAGRLDIDGLISHRVGLDAINDAMAEMSDGVGLRWVIGMQPGQESGS